MQAAIATDLAWLFKRLPDLDHDLILDCQIREMRTAAVRADAYDVDVPWYTEKWHGITILPDKVDMPSTKKAAKSARVKVSTGKGRINTGEK